MGDSNIIRTSDISDRDHHIPHKTVTPDALDRGSGEARPERGIIKPRKICKLWGREIGTSSHFRDGSGLRELVPRARRQTIVTAVDTIAHQRAQVTPDRTLVFDGQIRNAPPGSDLLGGRRDSS